MINDKEKLTTLKFNSCSVITLWIHFLIHFIIMIICLIKTKEYKNNFYLINTQIITPILVSVNIFKKRFNLYKISLIFSVLNSLGAIIYLFYPCVISLEDLEIPNFWNIMAFILFIIIELFPAIILLFLFSYYKRLIDINDQNDENLCDDEKDE